MSFVSSVPPESQQNAREVCAAAERCLERGDRIAAVDLGRYALKLDPACSSAHHLLARVALEGDHFREIFKRIHQNFRPRTYLEIGVGGGATVALSQEGTDTIGIDPEPQLTFTPAKHIRIFRETSDEFFSRRNLNSEFAGRALEIAFIDGMHLFEYALRDFINVERNSTLETRILVHDCYPLDAITSARERSTTFWTGDIWKLTLCLGKYRPDLSVHTLAAPPSGLAVIRNTDPRSTVLPEKLKALCDEFVPMPYSTLERCKADALNLVPGDWHTALRILG
jgi:hypothetical protein